MRDHGRRQEAVQDLQHRLEANRARFETLSSAPGIGITHRRGGYRDPESQAFIESWFGQFTKRCAWRAEWESLDQARKEIAAYIDTYHGRPHSGLGYRTPAEVAATWRSDPEPEKLQTLAT